MQQVRIALAQMPEELNHLVQQSLADQPDFALVAVAAGEIALLLEAARADVVVVATANGEMPAVADRLLDEYPRLGVVCLDTEAGCGVVYRLRPARMAFGEVSPHAIVAAIRRAAEDTTSWEAR